VWSVASLVRSKEGGRAVTVSHGGRAPWLGGHEHRPAARGAGGAGGRLPACERERDALAPTYQRLVQAGHLTRRQAQREHPHEIWEGLAPALGLRGPGPAIPPGVD
jgi:hypothetical protein